MKKLLLSVSLVLLANGGNISDYKKSCNNGSGLGCWLVGYDYEYGKDGVKQDYFKANEYYKKGCKLNDGSSCCNLGYLYDNGQGVRQNKSIAKNYYGKACDLKSQLGCKNYSILNSQGY